MQIIPAEKERPARKLLHGLWLAAPRPREMLVEGGRVVDLEGARSGKPSEDLWRSFGDMGVRFQIGGGIRATLQPNGFI